MPQSGQQQQPQQRLPHITVHRTVSVPAPRGSLDAGSGSVPSPRRASALTTRSNGRYSDSGVAGPVGAAASEDTTQQAGSQGRDQASKVVYGQHSPRETAPGKVYNHYAKPAHRQAAPVTKSPRTVTVDCSLPKIPGAEDKAPALQVLSNTTHAARSSAPPSGGWKHWQTQSQFVTFEPPPLRSQSAVQIPLPLSVALPPGSPPRGHLSFSMGRPSSEGLSARASSSRGGHAHAHVYGHAPVVVEDLGPMDRDPHKPLTDDVLNLWRGKRLNKAEIKLEAKLHLLRNNPTARMQLEDTVRHYIDERTQASLALATSLAAKAEAKEAQKAAVLYNGIPVYYPEESEQTPRSERHVYIISPRLHAPPPHDNDASSSDGDPPDDEQRSSGKLRGSGRLRLPGLGGSGYASGDEGSHKGSDRRFSLTGGASVKWELPLNSAEDDLLDAELSMSTHKMSGRLSEPGLSTHRGGATHRGSVTSRGGQGTRLSDSGRPKRLLVHQVTLSEWRSRRKLLSEAQVKIDVAAATRIAAHWKGYKAKTAFRKIRAAVLKIQEKVRPRYTAEAVLARRLASAAMVIRFLQVDCSQEGVGNMKALRQQFLHNRRAEKKLELVYTMRVALLARQWGEVEKILLNTAKRRTRSGASPAPTAEEHTANSQAQLMNGQGQVTAKEKSKAKLLGDSMAARKKGILPCRASEEGGSATGDSRNLTAASATESCHATDRMVLETLTPVPQEVKGAIIASYLTAKQNAYYALIGLHWQAMARHRRENHMAEMMAAARNVVKNTAATASASNSDIPSKPKIPKMRVLGTPPELKAMMQQGVAETAIFHAYVLKANLDEYEQELYAENQRLHANAEVAAVIKTKKKHMRTMAAGNAGSIASWAATATQLPGIDELVYDGPAGAFAAATGSGLLLTHLERSQATALKHVWWSDASMRAGPCLRRRWQLLKVDLVECLNSRVFQTSDITAASFLDHRTNQAVVA